MQNKTKQIIKKQEEEFDEKWRDEMHDKLEELFPKDNQGLSRRSTTHRSEALSFNGLAFVFASSFIKENNQAIIRAMIEDLELQQKKNLVEIMSTNPQTKEEHKIVEISKQIAKATSDDTITLLESLLDKKI